MAINIKMFVIESIILSLNQSHLSLWRVLRGVHAGVVEAAVGPGHLAVLAVPV